MVISIRMNNEEKRVASAYAKLNGVSLSESIKKAYFEKIEDELDLVLADKAMKEYKKDKKTYTLDQIKKEFNL